jgi:hypothetical protein
MSQTLDDINDLIEQLELWNENTDGGGPGETVSVFVWPDEWTIWDGGEKYARKHQKEFGGKYAIVRIPGHTKPFDAQAEAIRVFRELGIRVLNPPRRRARTTGGTHTRYVGDVVVHLEHYGKGDYAAEISIVGRDEVVWESPINVTPAPDPDDPEVIDRLAASAVHLALTKSRNRRATLDIQSATSSAVDEHGGFEVARGNPQGPPPGAPRARGSNLLATIPTRESFSETSPSSKYKRYTVVDGWLGLEKNPAGACPACGCARHECECPKKSHAADLPQDRCVCHTPTRTPGSKLCGVCLGNLPKKNPAGLTAKGERMYEHVKESYGSDPRAKEIAARTVLARAGEGVSGLKKNPDPREHEYLLWDDEVGDYLPIDRFRANDLLVHHPDAEVKKQGLGRTFIKLSGLKKNPNPEYQWFVTDATGKIFSGWEYQSDAKDDLRDNGDFYSTQTKTGSVKVFSRRHLVSQGINPDTEMSWYKTTNPSQLALEVWTSFGERTIKNRKPQLVAVRLVREPTGWRVDYTEAVAGAWMPWESALSETFKTKAAAEKAARAWADAENISLEGFEAKGPKQNPSHAELERAAHGGPRSPDVDAWIKQYPKTWASMTKRSTR